MSAVEIRPLLRNLYSRHPEYLHHPAWELAQVLWGLKYTDDLAGEGEIAAAAEVGRQDYPEWWRAA